jgi:hypothetical protein
MNLAAQAPEPAPIETSALAGVAESDRPRLRLVPHPSVGYLASRFPVDTIWRAGRDGDAAGVDLDAGGVRLEIARRGREVVMRRLPPGTYAFRGALAAGRTLEAAAESALAADPNFDVTEGVLDLFRDRTVAGFTLDPAEGGKSS